MAASVSGCSMWIKGIRPICTLNHNIARVFSVRSHLRQCLKYSTTSAANEQASTTAKSQGAENIQNTEGSTEKVDASPREQELLLENEKLLESVKTLDDKYKRALADNENIRVRMRREISDAKQFGIQNFVKDLIEVADVLGKATESVPKDALGENAHLKSLFEGLQMTESQLLTVFKRHGVFPINPIGEKFNPNHHEALFEQVDSSKEPGTVGTVTQIGYRLHERLVRPAKVGVVKANS